MSLVSYEKEYDGGGDAARSRERVGKHFVGVAESDCVISEWNDCFFDESGEYITPLLLSFMLGDSAHDH